ncbi:hypothetical protein EHS25_006955 [Saitozyma podzolica]|uniref:54S ribosomal protein L22, mitochondrial n=1 Tax=Saitozyma podzolica TaxID=1890683 RepID=A0A427XRI2_9TREE|nr:hypothetical protein EHS25_006955 [Saitozyma podzolica]
MSRSIRSTLSLAQTATASASAGPSSLRPCLRPQLRTPPPTALQTRSAWSFGGFDRFMNFGRPSKAKKATEDESPALGDKAVTKAEGDSTGSLFDEIVEQAEKRERKRKASEHKYSTAHHKISPRKLNMLSRQVAGLPIDEAILQMQFSEKRASSWIKSTLALARDHAMDKGLSRSKLVVAETWVSKGLKIKRVDIKGRGRAGFKHHPTARLHVLLKEGKTKEEISQRKFTKELGQVRSAGVVREDGVIRRKVISGWTW